MTVPSSTVSLDDAGRLKIRVPYSNDNLALCRAIPEHHTWDTPSNAWLARCTPRNLRYVKTAFPDAVWSPEAAAAYEQHVATFDREVEEKRRLRYAAAVLPTDYAHGGPAPRQHQRTAFALSYGSEAFALLMEMRTGKTKVIIDTAFYLYKHQRIEQVLVVAPNTVKTVWVEDELPLHVSGDYAAMYWIAGGTKAQRRIIEDVTTKEDGVLRWFVVNVEALSTDRGRKICERFLKRAPTLFVIDESTRIKSPGASRTRVALRLAKLAPYRRILTGTPITQSPLDAWAQFKFLDERITGFTSFYAFRNHFAVTETITTGMGRPVKKVVGYKNLDELERLLEPHSYRVRSAECLDLPPKTYEKTVVELAPEQRKAYTAMRDEMFVKVSDTERVTAPIVLTQLLRLQQIIGGFLPAPETLSQFEANVFGLTRDLGIGAVQVGDQIISTADGSRQIEGPNPKLLALLELTRDLQGKTIVWARFRPEIDIIVNQLSNAYGRDAVVEFHGGRNDEERLAARRGFQTVDEVRFFVGQQQTGGMGIALDSASNVVYFSNTFSLEDRLQSEDRAIGKNKILYVDLVASDTIDETLIIPALRGKRELAAVVLGEPVGTWLA